jgi:hypothetical protein
VGKMETWSRANYWQEETGGMINVKGGLNGDCRVREGVCVCVCVCESLNV